MIFITTAPSLRKPNVDCIKKKGAFTFTEKIWSNTLLGPERVEFSDYTVDRTSTKMKDVLVSGSSWTPS